MLLYFLSYFAAIRYVERCMAGLAFCKNTFCVSENLSRNTILARGPKWRHWVLRFEFLVLERASINGADVFVGETGADVRTRGRFCDVSFFVPSLFMLRRRITRQVLVAPSLERRDLMDQRAVIFFFQEHVSLC